MLFKKDDLVFAKIKGYKPWPGRVLELKPGNKAMVFFFGTYDKGQVLMKDMWLYNEESKAKYAPANGKRPKKFQQALEEIVDWPDMLPYEGKSEEKHLDDSLEPDGIEPVEKKQRRDSEISNRKLWVQVKDTGDIIEIDLDKDRPKFNTKKEAMIYDDNRFKEALRFKSLVEAGKYVPPEVITRLEAKTNRNGAEQAILDKWMFLQEDRQEKIQWLKTEYKIADIEIQLRKILHPGKPDLESIIEHLQELNSLLVSKLMLKKQPQVFETIDRLCHYVGPKTTNNLSTNDKETETVTMIRSLANAIYSKWTSYFEEIPSNENFMENFKHLIETFRHSVRDLPEEKLKFMVCE